MTGPALIVAILTYRRPGDLEAVLPLVLEQLDTVPMEGGVLVVDNDPDAGARDQVLGCRNGRVRYVHEPRPGIAAARNRALHEAAAVDLLVFIDDDERPSAGWLASLLATYEATRPAAVVGPVVSEYAVEPDAWVAAGRFFDRRRLPTGTEVTVAATNNLLLDVSQLGGLTFDERFGLSGGSDTLFSAQLAARGARMVWCSEAMVTDWVPDTRTTRRWVLRRAFRSGNCWSRVTLEMAGGARARVGRRAALLLKGGVRVGGGGAQAFTGVCVRSASHRARGVRTVMRGAGMVTGALGYVFSEYRRDTHTKAGFMVPKTARTPSPRP